MNNYTQLYGVSIAGSELMFKLYCGTYSIENYVIIDKKLPLKRSFLVVFTIGV
jgi:hypothetical protein